MSKHIFKQIRKRTRARWFEDYVKRVLVELCGVDTTPSPDIDKMRAAEDACFRILERELSALDFKGARLERRPIDPAIAAHPNYSLLHFTKSASQPKGLSVARAYEQRSNLLYVLPGLAPVLLGQSVALNAHIDVVAPYFPPRVRGQVVYGRGACDDKGPVVAIVAALKVLCDVMPPAALKWRKNVLLMFVVEEETGGNGSLSLAMDRKLKSLYDSVVVSECTNLKMHPANRGAVWYRAELHPPGDVSALELFSFINEELEKEGRAIRAESRHPLFPQRPVQTCHGIIGPFGEHPSRICAEAAFRIRFQKRPGSQIRNLLRDCLEAGLADYTGLYGDKTKATEDGGKPLVARHYDLRHVTGGWEVKVHGASGHMGTIRERDGAITKMAHLVRGLVSSRPKLESLAGAPVRIELSEPPGHHPTPLILEGGQGFLPTHSLDEIKERLRRAAQRGAEHYLQRLDRPENGEDVVQVTYDKLHNVAFDGSAQSPTMRRAAAAARACGLWKNEPVVGWTASCDARLFATEYPGMDVLTFGPGQLAHAHSDVEQITVDELRAAAEFWAMFLLGTRM